MQNFLGEPQGNNPGLRQKLLGLVYSGITHMTIKEGLQFHYTQLREKYTTTAMHWVRRTNARIGM
jgi:hypothetical protein